jgi:hypothetical protein
MPTIKGFHMKDGKMTEETKKKMEEAGVKMSFDGLKEKKKEEEK